LNAITIKDCDAPNTVKIYNFDAPKIKDFRGLRVWAANVCRNNFLASTSPI